MNLVPVASLKEFFRNLLVEAARRQGVELQESTEFYLVNLLSEFADVGKLFQEVNGRSEQEPLALLYHRALTQARDDRIRTLRRLGDVSLYRAGFFSPSLRDSGVGADYYIQMGGAAYGQVASLSSATVFADVYRELEAKFRPLVEVLEEIAARGQVSNGPVGVLQVYESWSRTRNEHLERVLVNAGLVPPKGDLPN